AGASPRRALQHFFSDSRDVEGRTRAGSCAGRFDGKHRTAGSFGFFAARSARRRKQSQSDGYGKRRGRSQRHGTGYTPGAQRLASAGGFSIDRFAQALEKEGLGIRRRNSRRRKTRRLRRLL
ncbi:MAG: hypothetical protein AVDCRST_MAG74-2284, partial [uncultured Pyrinomonadaceae bacterium]